MATEVMRTTANQAMTRAATLRRTLSVSNRSLAHYVQLQGTIDNINLNKTTPEPVQFTFASPDIAAGPIKVFCLKGTNAAGQLEPLKNGTNVDFLGLRNIDLSEVLNNKYVINMLGIDIQAKP